MAQRIRDHDWSLTELGGESGWPQSLRTVVDILTCHGFPMIALWGPHLIQIYNDEYGVVMAGKHPAGLGQPTKVCWPEVWHINGPIYERVFRGETVTIEDGLYPLARSGVLEDCWFTLTYSPLRDDGGKIAGVLVTMIETTPRILTERARAASEQQLREALDYRTLLLSELQHRVRNSLRVISLIARKSKHGAVSIDDYEEALSGRIEAFARAQVMVSRDPAGGVDLATLLQQTIAAFPVLDSASVTAEGPQVVLTAKAGERLALAFHELCTNALKHGAFSGDNGNLSVRWTLTPDGVHLDWREDGVAELKPPARTGFGTEVLSRALRYELQAQTELVFGDNGLTWSAHLPAAHLQSRGAVS